MYYYVEYLRARRAMRVVAIILGVLAACAIGLRIYLIGSHSPEDVARALEQSPTAHVTRSTLADGTAESQVDDPQRGVRAVIDRRNGRLNMTISEPRRLYRAQTSKMLSMGSERENVTESGNMVKATITSGGEDKFDISALMAFSMIIGLVTATLLGAPLAKENAGHLELTWTKPVSRSQYAWAAIGVDSLSIVLAQCATVLVVLLCALLFVIPQIVLGSALIAGIALAAPLAWYALLTTLSASARQGPGLVIGLSWVAAIVVLAVAHATSGAQSTIGIAVHAVAQALAYFDPLAYASFSDGGLVRNGVVTTAAEAFVALCTLGILYLVAAVLQWRRVEA